MQGLGAIENDIYLRSEKINDILNDHPEMTLDEIKKIPQILENPILILRSRNVGRNDTSNSRMVLFGTLKAKNGLPVMTVLDLRPEENHIVIDDMQKVTSAYTKTSNPTDFVRNSDVMYVSKGKATSLLRTIGFQMPITLNESGFIGSISYKGPVVKLSGKKFSEVFSEEKVKLSRELDYIDFINEKADFYEYVDSIEENVAETDAEIKSRLKNEKALTNRQLLTTALESISRYPEEKGILSDYRAALEAISKAERRISDIDSKLKSMPKEERNGDTAKLLKAEKDALADEINYQDTQLLSLEAMQSLKGVIEREKKRVIDESKKSWQSTVKKRKQSRRHFKRLMLNLAGRVLRVEIKLPCETK